MANEFNPDPDHITDMRAVHFIQSYLCGDGMDDTAYEDAKTKATVLGRVLTKAGADINAHLVAKDGGSGEEKTSARTLLDLLVVSSLTDPEHHLAKDVHLGKLLLTFQELGAKFHDDALAPELLVHACTTGDADLVAVAAAGGADANAAVDMDGHSGYRVIHYIMNFLFTEDPDAVPLPNTNEARREPFLACVKALVDAGGDIKALTNVNGDMDVGLLDYTVLMLEQNEREVDKAIVEGLLALGAVFTSEDAEEAYHEAIGDGGGGGS